MSKYTAKDFESVRYAVCNGDVAVRRGGEEVGDWGPWESTEGFYTDWQMASLGWTPVVIVAVEPSYSGYTEEDFEKADVAVDADEGRAIRIRMDGISYPWITTDHLLGSSTIYSDQEMADIGRFRPLDIKIEEN